MLSVLSISCVRTRAVICVITRASITQRTIFYNYKMFKHVKSFGEVKLRFTQFTNSFSNITLAMILLLFNYQINLVFLLNDFKYK